MTPDDETVWSCVRRYRQDLADAFAQMDRYELETESWCRGWRVGDVLAHLVYLAEASVPLVAWDVLVAGGNFDRGMDRGARRLCGEPPGHLVNRLRAACGGRFHVPGTPPAVALGEVIVHGFDALGPLQGHLGVEPVDALMVIDIYVRMGRRAFHSVPHKGLRLVATDADWASGAGPEVRGRAVDLLVLTANRLQIVPALEGPGASRLLGAGARAQADSRPRRRRPE